VDITGEIHCLAPHHAEGIHSHNVIGFVMLCAPQQNIAAFLQNFSEIGCFCVAV
jgi:hypothetical protein